MTPTGRIDLTGSVLRGATRPGPLARALGLRGIWVVVLALAVAGMAFWPTPAQAQEGAAERGPFLVSNLEVGAAGSGGIQRTLHPARTGFAQAFTTGPKTGGYALGSIGIQVSHFFDTAAVPDHLQVTINGAASVGGPGGALCTLTHPPRFPSQGMLAFEAPEGEGACPQLAAETTYFVVIEWLNPSGTGRFAVFPQTYPLGGSVASDEDPGGAAGWSIADQSHYLSVSENARTWSAYVDTASFKIAVAEAGVTIAMPNNEPTGLPAITGTARAGQTLTADPSGIVDPDGLENAVFSYQWMRDDAGVAGATGETYELSREDVGSAMSVMVSFTDDRKHEETLTSAATAAVAQHPNRQPTGRPVIGGTAEAGETLTAYTSRIWDGNGLENAVFSYQWMRDDAGVAGETGRTYALGADDVGSSIKVRVSFTDDDDHEESVTSAATPPVWSDSPTAALRARFVNLPAAHDGRTPFTFRLQFSKEVSVGWRKLEYHAFSVTGGAVTGPSRVLGFGNRRWNIEITPDSNADLTIILPVTTDCDADGAICTAAGEALSERVEYTVPGPAQQQRSNSAPTGLPTIAGTAQVGRTLTADASLIVDPDGLDNAAFSAQWMRGDGNGHTDIAGETGQTYELSDDDVGKTIKVRVTFTDDADNEETLTSAATAVVAAGLAVRSAAVDGDTLALTYNERLDTGVTLPLSAFTVTVNGSSRSLESVSVAGSAVTLILSPAAAEGDTVTVGYARPDGADFIRDRLGRAAASFNRWEVTNDTPPPPLGAGFGNLPPTHDGRTPFTFRLQFSEEVNVGWSLLEYHAFSVTGGAVTGPSRVNSGSNRLWDIEITPDSGAAVTIILPVTTDCDAEGAICTAGGKMLSERVEHTVSGPSNRAPTGLPAITGRAQAGRTLTADTSGIDDADGLTKVSYRYQWMSDGADVDGATARTYEPSAGDVGTIISVRVSFADDGRNEATLTSAATAVVAPPNNEPTGLPAITGTARAGETLTADPSGIGDADGLDNAAFAYQWMRDDADIAGEIAQTYDLSGDNIGKTIRVRVTFTDDAENEETLTSEPVAAVQAQTNPLIGTWPYPQRPRIPGEKFSVYVRFSEAVALDVEHMMLAPQVEGGSVVEAQPLTMQQISWYFGVQPDSKGNATVTLPVPFNCDDPGAICTHDRKPLSQPYVLVREGGRENQEPTGLPVIDGAPHVGATLTARTGGISDGNGLSEVVFLYQWILVDGEDETVIAGATARTYEVGQADLGQRLRVRVSYEDDDSYAEELTSEPTAAVSPPVPLTASVVNEPQAHDGQTPFTFELRFSEEVEVSFRELEDHVFTVTGGTVTSASRPEGETGNLRWVIEVTPDSKDDVTVVLPVTTDCDSQGAICTTDGKMLAGRVELTVVVPNSDPTGLPTVTGTAQAGQTLTADTSGINDADGLDNVTYGYQWIANDGNGDADIAGETGRTYELSDGDVGRTIRVMVTFTDDRDHDETLTSAATAAVEARPNAEPTGLPTISGTALAGQTLTASTSGIADEDGLTSPTFSYQWIANDGNDDADIAGETGQTYDLSGDDVGKTIRVRVTFTDDWENEETLTSAATAAVEYVAGPPGVPLEVKVKAGDAAIRVSWQAPAHENRAPVEEYRVRYREEGGSDQERLTTGLSETLDGLTNGVTYVVQVEARNAAGYGTSSDELRATSRPAGSVAPDTPEGFTAEAIHHLRMALDWDDVEGADRYDVQFYDFNTDTLDVLPFNGITVVFDGSSAVVDNLPEGRFWWLQVRAVNTVGVSEWTELEMFFPTRAADWENNAPTGLPTITGTAQAGETLTASTSGITDADGLDNVVYSYQWVANDGNADADIAGATARTYDLTDGDVGKAIKVRVTFSDDAENEETLTSAATAAVEARPNTEPTGLPTISGTAQAGETLTASTSGITDADGLDNAVFSYQWIANDGNDDADIAGATARTYEVSDDDVGKTIKVRVTFTDDRDNEETLTSAATAAVEARPNTEPTGLPTISGTAQAGETLTASTSGIDDADGLDNAVFAYQWIANDGNDDADIAGATARTYELSDGDVGKTIRVRVTFTDDAENEETLTSAATAAVEASATIWSATMTVGAGGDKLGYSLFGPIGELSSTQFSIDETTYTVWLVMHDADKLYFRLNNDPPEGLTLHLGDLELALAGATVVSDQGSNIYRWHRGTVSWSAGDKVPLSLSLTGDEEGSDSAQNTEPTGLPTINGTTQAGQTLTADTSGIADADGLDNVTYSYQWIRSDEDGDAHVAGETARTYGLSDDDVGKTIKVRVTFTDAAENEETLTSEGTETVTMLLWSATLTAGSSGTDSGYLADRETGAVSEDEFSLGITTYRVKGLTESDDGLLSLSVDGSLPTPFTLHAGAVRFASEDATTLKGEAGYTYQWDEGPPDWSDGEKVEVALTVPETPLVLDRVEIPETHRGSANDFSFELHFSEEVPVSYLTLRDHAFTITGGTVGKAQRLTQGSNIGWRITVTPDSDADVTVVLPVTTDCDASGAICTGDGRKLSNSLSFTVSGPPQQPQNSEATGAPAISGTLRVGETLTAAASGIADADGMDNASFSYQWMRGDGNTHTDIAGETGRTYDLSGDDVGRTIKVRVSFRDDANNEETLTSAATGVVAPRPPLTASFQGQPSSHDGQADFTFELHFSEELPVSYLTLRDHAFTVTGGTVIGAQRLTQGSNIGWRITVTPDSNADVTVVLPVTTDCDASGAICTGDGRMLSTRNEFTVSGP